MVQPLMAAGNQICAPALSAARSPCMGDAVMRHHLRTRQVYKVALGSIQTAGSLHVKVGRQAAKDHRCSFADQLTEGQTGQQFGV